MVDSIHMALPLMAADQAQKHVTHNEALLVVDMMTNLSVLNKTLTAPPGSPTDGDRHIIAAAATGDWVGLDNSVALRINGAWFYRTPHNGLIAWDDDVSSHFKFSAGVWSAL